MMTVNWVYSASDIFSFERKSTTGMTVPLRFITPLMCGGVLGIGVMVEYPLISCTLRISTPYSSWPSVKVRYWFPSAAKLI
jgi:hypothetical protein